MKRKEKPLPLEAELDRELHVMAGRYKLDAILESLARVYYHRSAVFEEAMDGSNHLAGQKLFVFAAQFKDNPNV